MTVAKPHQGPETRGEADNTNVGQMWSAGCGGFSVWALIWYWDHLKNFIAEIPQGPLGMSIGTIWMVQKRFQGPPARGF